MISGNLVSAGICIRNGIDVATNAIETPTEVAATLRKALDFVDIENLYPSTNCGMAPLSRSS